MPHLSLQNRQYIEALKSWYQSLPEDAKRSLPHRVSFAILQYKSDSENESVQALELCSAFLNEAVPIKRPACLEVFVNSSLMLAVYELNRAGLLTGDVAQVNFDALVGHQYPFSVAVGFEVLNRAGLLAGDSAQANREAVAGHQNPLEVARALDRLHCNGLLTGDSAQANRDAVIRHQNPDQVAEALFVLSSADLLTGDAAQVNRDAVVGHPRPHSLARALELLNHNGLLTGDSAQANRHAVVAGYEAAFVLTQVHRAGLLTGDAAQLNRDAVVGLQCFFWVSQVLEVLHRAGLLAGDLAQDNFDAVVHHEEALNQICVVLGLLDHAGLLAGDATQANFDALILHSAILTHAEITVFCSRIPTHRFTQAQFASLIEICLQHTDNPAAGRKLVVAHIKDEILDVNDSSDVRAVILGGFFADAGGRANPDTDAADRHCCL
jgi:hypothetical protein